MQFENFRISFKILITEDLKVIILDNHEKSKITEVFLNYAYEKIEECKIRGPPREDVL